MKVRLTVVGARLRGAFVSGAGSVTARELLLLELQDARGVVGSGEAAPLPGYDGVSLDDVRAALDDCAPLLADADDRPRTEILAACAARAIPAQALAAIDLALWDLAGRRTGLPVWRLLGGGTPAGDGAPAVEVNATIAAADRSGAARAAASASAAGFRTVKLKVGIGDDAGRLAAVRAAAGPAMAIRLDANGAWSVTEAVAALSAFAPAGLELCEQPVAALAAIAVVAARTAVPIAIDESSATPGALDTRVCDAVCLKISRCGGISRTIDAARHARAAGYRVYLASTLDGPLGIAAALHAAHRIAPELPCGLATLDAFDGPESPLPARAGQITLPAGAGLGDGLLPWYALG
ncbi:MAG: enolase C-terminal domain-like protein [Solirubrobacteraceae bacterium]